MLAALALVIVSVALVPAARGHDGRGAITGAVARAPQRGPEPFVLTAKSSADQLTVHARDIERGPGRWPAATGLGLIAAALLIVHARRRAAPTASDSTDAPLPLRRRGPPALAG